jgi:predicted ATPase
MSNSLPLTSIVYLEATDVVCDGGFKSLIQHEKFSSLLDKSKEEFDSASKLQQPLVALKLLNDWRLQNNGRFVKFEAKRELWNDVGDKKSRELISRALRHLVKSNSSLSGDAEEGNGSTSRQLSDASSTQDCSACTRTTTSSTEEPSFLSAVKKTDSSPKSFPGIAPLANTTRRVSASIRQNTKKKRHLYGRSQEQEKLIALYKQSISDDQKKTDFLVLSGESGVGKTALALSLESTVLQNNGFFVQAKFEQLTPEDPSAAFISIFNDLARIIVSMENKDLQRKHCEKIAAIMENLDEMIISAVPALGQVLQLISKSSSQIQIQTIDTDMDDQMAKQLVVQGTHSIPRLKYTFTKILREIVSPQHPLVVLLDDIQYASSYHAFADFLMDVFSHQAGVFFVATHRTDSSCQEYAGLDEFLSQLNTEYFQKHDWQLGGLPQQAVHELIADTLSLDSAKLETLSQTFCDLTCGNALFLLELLRTFQEDDLLRYDEKTNQWKCDDHLINQHPLLQVHSLRDLFVSKILELPEGVQETLKLAATLGPSFPEHVLYKLTDPKEARSHCDLAIEVGLLTRNDDTGDGRVLAFRHDSIHHATYGLIPDAKKAIFALQLGKRLWRHVDEKEMEKFIFVILRLVFRGEDLLQEKADRVAVASLCLQAAEKAVKSTGFHKSATYLQFGISVLGPRKWREHYDLCLDLFNKSTEAYYGTGQFDKVDELVEEVLSKARTFEDSFQARMMRVYTLGTTQRTVDAVEHGLETLYMLGEKIPDHPTKLHVFFAMSRTRRRLNKQTDATLLRLPLMTDQKKIAAMMIMQILFLNAYHSRPFLAVLISCRIIEMTIKYGASAISTMGFAGYGVVISR